MNGDAHLEIFFLLLKQPKQIERENEAACVDSHAKPQCSWHVCLPVGTVEHKHPSEAAEEHPVRVGAQLHCYTGSQHHKHYKDNFKKTGCSNGASHWLRYSGGGGTN